MCLGGTLITTTTLSDKRQGPSERRKSTPNARRGVFFVPSTGIEACGMISSDQEALHLIIESQLTANLPCFEETPPISSMLSALTCFGYCGLHRTFPCCFPPGCVQEYAAQLRATPTQVDTGVRCFNLSVVSIILHTYGRKGSKEHALYAPCRIKPRRSVPLTVLCWKTTPKRTISYHHITCTAAA